MSWRDTDVEAGVARQQERALVRYEAEQDRLSELAERQELEDDTAAAAYWSTVGVEWGSDYGEQS